MPISETLETSRADDPFAITSALEIHALMRSIQNNRGLIQMQAQGGSASIVTAILAVDPASNSFVVDNSSDEKLNQRIAGANAIMFETVLDGVRIQFIGRNVKVCNHEGAPAFELTLPDSLTRLQRRENYRIDIFVSEPAICTFTLRQKDANKTTILKKLTIKDISAGGISVWDNEHILDDGQSTTYAACRLELPEVGIVEADLRVVQTIDSTFSNEKERRLIGLKFVNLPGVMQTKVQNYIRTLERKLIAKKRGYD